MIHEVRFQTVEPQRRDAYVKMYKQAIQDAKRRAVVAAKSFAAKMIHPESWFCSSGRAKSIISTGAARQRTRAFEPLSKAGRPNLVKAAIMLRRISSAP